MATIIFDLGVFIYYFLKKIFMNNEQEKFNKALKGLSKEEFLNNLPYHDDRDNPFILYLVDFIDLYKAEFKKFDLYDYQMVRLLDSAILVGTSSFEVKNYLMKIPTLGPSNLKGEPIKARAYEFWGYVWLGFLSTMMNCMYPDPESKPDYQDWIGKILEPII